MQGSRSCSTVYEPVPLMTTLSQCMWQKISGTSKITSQSCRFHSELPPHHQGWWMKNCFGVLTRTLLKRRDPHYDENQDYLIQFTLDWSPSSKFMLLSDCSPRACSQLSFKILFCYPLYEARPHRPCAFWMRSAARPPSGCSSFGLSVNQHIARASNSQCILILVNSLISASVKQLVRAVTPFCRVRFPSLWRVSWNVLKVTYLGLFTICWKKC